MNFAKTIIVPSMACFYDYLQTRVPKTDIFTYRNKVVIRETVSETLQMPSSPELRPYYSLRAWRSNSVLDIWYDEMGGSGARDNFIAALDYVVEDDRVKIEYLNLNDAEYSVNYYLTSVDANYMNNDDAQILTKHLIAYAENVARDHEKSHIVIDVHGNMRLFHKYYKGNGFVETGVRCRDNPYWVEVVKDVSFEPPFHDTEEEIDLENETTPRK